ncbi:MAG: octanoyltransferase [Gammaproteobacteria bacterium]|nr:MAG: octanoyltransferase [Gammaproteobacteria bacterium]
MNSNLSSKILISDLGFENYQTVLSIQEDLQKQRIKGKASDTLFLVEHEPVYTLGKNANRDHLLQSRDKSIKVFNTGRGGDVTFHGPGQLVGYPILDLRNYKKSVSWYMRRLEELTIRVLKEFDIKGSRIKGLTGVWVNNKKIAAQGVRISRWVTMHGFSINVCPQLSYYEGIIPCGIFNYEVTSMEECLKKKLSMEKIKYSVSKIFLDLFNKENFSG